MLAFIIAVVALIIAINADTAIKKLKEENQSLRNSIEHLLRQNDSNYQQNDNIPHQNAQQPPVKIQQEIRQPIQQAQPIQQKPRPQLQQKQKQQKSNMENVFGKNVIGIVASILIFIGIIAFGTLVFTSLTDGIKVFAMFLASALVTGAGLFITKKSPSVFANILSGCGIGMIYISIFITHLYFGLINDIITFVLIFLWSIGVSFLSKKFKIDSLSYVALVGCIIASIFSLMYGFTENKFIEITIYHILTFILLIIANKENIPLFKLSSFASIILNTILSITIFSQVSVEENTMSFLSLCFILGIYNIAILVLQFREDSRDREVDITFTGLAHIFNLVCSWFIPLYILITDVWFNTDNVNTIVPIDFHVQEFKMSLTFFCISFFMICISYLAYHIFIKNQSKKTFMFVLSEIILAIIITFIPVVTTNGTRLGFLILLPIANLILSKIHMSKNENLAGTMYWTGFAFLIADCFISLVSIFAFEKIGILYSIALIALSFWYMYERFGTMFRFPFFQTAIINTHLLATMLNLLASTESDPFIGIIILLFINIAHSGYSRFATQTDKVSDILSEITESILASILLIVIALCKSDYPATTFISSILLFPMLLIRIKTLVDEKNPLLSVWYGIKFTFYTYITTAIFTNINDQQFIVSVLFMVLAGICIAFGFMKELKALRIYGLVMIMSSVFKMVVIDVWNQESIIRVVSLIAGGIICFAISAAYSKFEKRQTVEITEGKSVEDGE